MRGAWSEELHHYCTGASSSGRTMLSWQRRRRASWFNDEQAWHAISSWKTVSFWTEDTLKVSPGNSGKFNFLCEQSFGSCVWSSTLHWKRRGLRYGNIQTCGQASDMAGWSGVWRRRTEGQSPNDLEKRHEDRAFARVQDFFFFFYCK